MIIPKSSFEKREPSYNNWKRTNDEDNTFNNSNSGINDEGNVITPNQKDTTNTTSNTTTNNTTTTTTESINVSNISLEKNATNNLNGTSTNSTISSSNVTVENIPKNANNNKKTVNNYVLAGVIIGFILILIGITILCYFNKKKTTTSYDYPSTNNSRSISKSSKSAISNRSYNINTSNNNSSINNSFNNNSNFNGNGNNYKVASYEIMDTYKNMYQVDSRPDNGYTFNNYQGY